MLTVRRVRDWYSQKVSSSSNSDSSNGGISNNSVDHNTAPSQAHGSPKVYMPDCHELLSGSKYKVMTEVSSNGRNNRPGERLNWNGIEVERAVDVV